MRPMPIIMSAVLTLTVWLPSPARILDTPTKPMPTFATRFHGLYAETTLQKEETYHTCQDAAVVVCIELAAKKQHCK